MLRKKYKFDKEFDILIHLIGEMDDSLDEIDKILTVSVSRLIPTPLLLEGLINKR